MNEELKSLARKVCNELLSRELTLSTAESCTGGLVAAAITSVPGSSAVFNGGIVAYSNDVKQNVLGVPEDILSRYGAVSEQTVRCMVEGVARLTKSDCAVAVSGIAGPGGGTKDKPVGTVWIAVSVRRSIVTKLLQLEDKGREENIRLSAVEILSLLSEKLSPN